MKKIVPITLFAALLLSACNAKTKDEVKAEDDKGDKIEATNKVENKMRVIELTKAAFLEKIANYETNKDWKYLGDKPAIVQFHATWCGPCKVVAPILEELAGEYDKEIIVYKVDVDQEQELAELFGIRSVPSLLFIPMEGSPQMSQGAAPKPDLKKAIDEILLKKQI